MFLLSPKVLKGRVPIGTKSSYPAQKFLLGVFLLGPKVPIGLTDEFIGLKNSSQSAQFWFLLGVFLLGAPPVAQLKSTYLRTFTWVGLPLERFERNFKTKDEINAKVRDKLR